MKSWDLKKEEDCFGNDLPCEIQHIWSLNKGGSDIKENRIVLSVHSSHAMKNKTKGYVNGIRFSIVRAIDK